MNRHLAIKMSCFCVLEFRNSPVIKHIPSLESEHFNHNLFDPDLIRGSLAQRWVQNPYYQAFTGEVDFQVRLPDMHDFLLSRIA